MVATTYSASKQAVVGGQTYTVVVSETHLATSTVVAAQNGEWWDVYQPGAALGTDPAQSSAPVSAPAPAPSNLSSTATEESSIITDSTSTNVDSNATQSTSAVDVSDVVPSPSAPAKTSEVASNPSSSGKGIGSGAVAGAAIGCLVAGLVLGLVAAFLLFRRRRKRASASPTFVALEPQHAESKYEPPTSLVSSTGDAGLGQFLLDATPDKEIQAELRALSELIYQHVETYYHGPQAQGDSIEATQSLVNVGYSPELSGLQTEAIAAICLAPKTSRVGLRHVLSHIIFRSLDFNSVGSLSMLPLAVAAMAQANHTAGNPDSPAISLARSRWRSLSALLLHPNPTERTPLPVSVDETHPKAYSLANKLNTFLQPFVAQDFASRQDQTNHLQAVILECTRLGYVLLSQPGDWGFVFSNRATTMDTTRSIVVCPGLERLSQNDGTRYKSPKEVARPETMPL